MTLACSFEYLRYLATTTGYQYTSVVKLSSLAQIFNRTNRSTKKKKKRKTKKRTYNTTIPIHPQAIAKFLSGGGGLFPLPPLPPPPRPRRFANFDFLRSSESSAMAPVTSMATETASQMTVLAMTRIYDAVDGVGSLWDLDLGRSRSSPNVQSMPVTPCRIVSFFYPLEGSMSYGRTMMTATIAVYCSAPWYVRVRIPQAIPMTTIMEAYPIRYVKGLIT